MSFSGHDPYDPSAIAQARTAKTFKNVDGFYPDIDQGEFLLVERITNEYRTESIEQALILAMNQANLDLHSRACEWVKLGYESLVSVPNPALVAWVKPIEVTSEPMEPTPEPMELPISIYEHLYKTMVFAWAKCHLLHAYPTMNRKKEAENMGKDADERCPDLMARYNSAMGQLLGNSSGVRFATV